MRPNTKQVELIYAAFSNYEARQELAWAALREELQESGFTEAQIDAIVEHTDDPAERIEMPEDDGTHSEAEADLRGGNPHD